MAGAEARQAGVLRGWAAGLEAERSAGHAAGGHPGPRSREGPELRYGGGSADVQDSSPPQDDLTSKATLGGRGAVPHLSREEGEGGW